MTALERYEPGDKVRLTLIRNGKALKRNLTLAAPEE